VRWRPIAGAGRLVTVAMKFWMWTGEVPRLPNQVVSSSGVVVNDLPEHYELLAPAANFLTGSAAEAGKLEGTYLAAYYITTPDGRWAVANCWDQYFDSLDCLLSSDDKKVARGTARAVEESWPTVARLLQDGDDLWSHEAGLGRKSEGVIHQIENGFWSRSLGPPTYT
jgi:hypothetical protein